MKIMLIEDNKTKREDIKGFLLSKNVADGDIILAESMTDFSSNLYHDIGLFIIDLKLPNYDGGEALFNGKTILETIKKSSRQESLLLAISSFPDEFPNLRDLYESHGCILSTYSNKQSWKSTLEHLLIQLKKNITLDFLIFCALKEERDPYITMINGKKCNRRGIDFYDIEIGDKKGSVVLLPSMGLVNAAIISGACIDRYKPSIVAMSGICGGFSENAKLGQLLVSKMAYEYQSGKWTDDGFKQEPYQVSTDQNTLTNLGMLIDQDNFLDELENDFGATKPKEATPPMFSVFTSGSAVVASKDLSSNIQNLHRKASGLDMEIFAIHRAAELSINKPLCICAKTVVDLCDSNKSDDLHVYGSFISARFVISAINNHYSLNK
ncbi:MULTISPECIES: nucleoside phosphorylase [Enterobacteriaceae]|uniref:5'-methylthioadenosine/S-adenosylhomocysteine nucleosidase family protein n=1 Tax=Enterobacteriaceae TaxID=543 RepID=UPI0006DBD131|nr:MULTISPECIES: nucleoside phosphorylase [Enterobacteriaceae]OCO57279.1 nucleoside phosphorylase [Citrobacter freundii]MCW4845603.1 hypothetical protein [Enterobacter hormaechei subsp. xiangfangensis]MCW4859725.1 hypothetical protein [Enterobacter mori]MDM3377320.1 hypothetical protein [Citrobacter sp. Cb010]MDM3457218.1 hypothetical protein [Citrobacter sp. Cb036]